MQTAHQGDKDLCRAMKALGSPVRVAILRFVMHHPNCISNDILLHLPPDYARAQSTLSQHLKILRDAHLLDTMSDGSATSYFVNEEQIDWLNRQIALLHA